MSYIGYEQVRELPDHALLISSVLPGGPFFVKLQTTDSAVLMQSLKNILFANNSDTSFHYTDEDEDDFIVVGRVAIERLLYVAARAGGVLADTERVLAKGE